MAMCTLNKMKGMKPNMNNNDFNNYLNKKQYKKLTNLTNEQLEIIISSHKISFLNKVDIIITNKQYSYFNKFELNTLIKELEANKDKLEKYKIIKILCTTDQYERIGKFIDNKTIIDLTLNKIDVNDIITQEEILISIISTIKYYNKKIQETKNFEEVEELTYKIEQIKSMLLYFEIEIQELIKTKNRYFKENFTEIIDLDYLQTCDTKIMIELFQNSAEDLIINIIPKLPKRKIIELINMTANTTKEIKDKIITRDIAIKFNEEIKFFENLPNDKLNLIAYYGNSVFENDGFKRFHSIYKLNLKSLIEKRLTNLSQETQKIIINLYGNIPSRTIEFILKNLMIDNQYIEKMQSNASKYFSSNLNQAIIFQEKYPNLSKKIFNTNLTTDNDLKELLEKLSEKAVLESIDTLNIEELKETNLENYSYSTSDRTLATSKQQIGSIENHNNGIILYNYSKEIIKLDINCNITNYNARSSHSVMYGEIYSSEQKNIANKNVMEIIHEANLTKGDILLATENAGLIIYFPPTITTNQKEQVIILLNQLKQMKTEISISLGIAIPNTKKDYVELNNNKFFNPEEAIEELNRIKVDDNCTYLSQEASKQK